MWWLRKTNETTRFKVKNLGGIIARKQSTISSWDLQFRISIHSKSSTVTKLGSASTDFLDLELVLTWTTCSCFGSPT